MSLKILNQRAKYLNQTVQTTLTSTIITWIHKKSPIFTYPTCILYLLWGDPIWVLPRFSATEK